MKLYYTPGACSQAVHIVAREVGVPLDLELVDLKEHRVVSTGEPLAAINPKNSVPALVLDDGMVLTEGAALLQFVAQSAGAEKLLGGSDTIARFRVLEWLNFIATELHKSLGPLFGPLDDPAPAAVMTRVDRTLGIIRQRLAAAEYLAGQSFTVADAYAFVILGWLPFLGVALDESDPINAYRQRIAQRPAVAEALKAEGFGS